MQWRGGNCLRFAEQKGRRGIKKGCRGTKKPPRENFPAADYIAILNF